MRGMRSRSRYRVLAFFTSIVVAVSMTSTAGADEDETHEGAHNLSVPLIFAEGIGLGGAEVVPGDVTSTGIGGLLKEACEGAEHWGDADAVTYVVEEPDYSLYLNGTLSAFEEITTGKVDPLPPDGDYFLQPPKAPLPGSNANGEDTCWEADWIDGTGLEDPVAATRADWGDNLVSVGWRVGVPIRVEVALFQDAVEPGVFQDGTALSGYPMTKLWPPPVYDGMPAGVGGGMPLEVWATASGAGSSGVLTPGEFAMVYTRAAHLTIDRLAWAMDGSPSGLIPDPLDDGYAQWVAHPVSDETIWGTVPGEGKFGAEVNQAGKVVYGKQLKASAPGWYRITFSIDRSFDGTTSNVEIGGLDPSDLAGEVAVPEFVEDSTNGNYVYLDIYVSEGIGDPPYGKMLGRVTDRAGTPLEGIDVTVFDLAKHGAGSMTTDAAGSFTGQFLHGSYRLLFEDPSGTYLGEWFDDRSEFLDADLVFIPQTKTLQAALALPTDPKPGVIQGTVTDALSATALSGATVEVMDEGVVVKTDITPNDGAFHFTLEEGDYTLKASASGYVTQWYDNAAGEDDASLLEVRSGSKKVVNIALVRQGAAFEGFVDVDSDNPFAGDIAWLKQAGITLGCNPPDNTMFCPDAPVTRAQMASFLVRALDLGAPVGDHFTDDDTSVHENDINSLFEAGITFGCNPPDNDEYCPGDPVIRAQMASFLVRALDLDPPLADHFVDDESSVHENDINSLFEAGVTRGCNPPDNDEYCPNSNVTRAQMAAFLHRALG